MTKPKAGDARYLREDVYDASRRLTPAGSKVVVVSVEGVTVNTHCAATGMSIHMGSKSWEALLKKAPKWAKFDVSSIDIRSVTNIEPVVELEGFAEGEPLPRKGLVRMMRGKYGAAAGVLLASLKGRPVGHLVYTPDPKWATIDRLVVHPDLRRMGCATALVKTLRTKDGVRRHGWIRSWVPEGSAYLAVHKTLAALGFVANADDGVMRFGFREYPDLVLKPERQTV